MKAIIVILALVCLVSGCVKGAETKGQQVKRWRQEFSKSVGSCLTNNIVGIRTVIEGSTNTGGDDPRLWSSVAEVEFINHSGGMERTKIYMDCEPVALSTNSILQVFAMASDGFTDLRQLTTAPGFGRLDRRVPFDKLPTPYSGPTAADIDPQTGLVKKQ